MGLTDGILMDLQTTYDGDAWHGTPLRRMLDDVGEARAKARPIPTAHTIAELLCHISAWIEIVDRRLDGEEFEVTPELDFPGVEGVPWDQSIARLERAHARLIASVSKKSDENLAAVVKGQKYTSEFMLRGLVNHNTYHAGQIAMLKK